MMGTGATAGRLGGAQKGEKQVSIRPTVLIGLGGTGKEVLRRLRRMFYEKYRMPGLPVMEFLWFDTDIENSDITGKETDSLDRHIKFSAGEMLDGSVEPQHLEGYRQNKGMHPHIWSWFPDALDSLASDAITQGAGQIRPCGRLAFFHHYAELRDKIKRKIDHVTSVDARTAMKRMFSDFNADSNDLEIVLVTSIAGGTGSGSFIDMGFLCRDIFPNAVRTAYLVLPSVFDRTPGARQTRQANGFAAIKELEHYMKPRFDAQGSDGSHSTTHTFEWDGREHSVPAPPFSTVYLLDGKNFAGEHVEDHTDVFQMIAEFLLLDFDQTRFAMDKRSVRSNMEQYLQESATYKNGPYVQYFPCRYASFGLSQMEINQPRLANAASNRFAQYLVDFIIAKDNPVPPGYREANVLPQLEQLNLTTDLLIARALNRPGADFTLADDAINKILRPVFSDLEQEIRKAPEAREVAVLEAQVAEAKSTVESVNLEIQEKVAEKLKEEGTFKGDDIKQIIDNVVRLRPELERGLEDHCIGLLCDPLERGPNFVEDFLKHGKEELEKVLGELTRLANEQMEGPKISAIDVEFSDDFHHFDKRLKQARDLFLAWQTKKIAVRHYETKKDEALRECAQKVNRDLLNQVETTRQELSDWVQKRFRKDAARYLIGPVEGIINLMGSRAEVRGEDGKVSLTVSGIQQQVQIFRENLRKMADGFSTIHQAYIRRVPGVRNLNLTPELNYAEEIPKYLRQVREDWTEADLPRLCRRALDNYFRSEEAKDLFVDIATAKGEVIDFIKVGTREIFKRSAKIDRARPDWDKVRDTMDDYTFRLFKDFKTDLYATEELRRRFGDRENEEIVKRSQLAAPWVSETHSGLPRLVDISNNCIGVAGRDKSWVSDVNLVTSPAKGDPYQETEHRDDSIVFVNQWMAFPLLSIDNIFDMGEDYEANIEGNAVNVYQRHMVKNYLEFADILPPRTDAEVRALIQAQRTLINGLIMGIVKYDDQKKFYRPYYIRGIEDVDRYGHNLDRARLRIGSDRNVKDRLDVEISKMEDQWRGEQPDERFIQRLALKSWLLNEAFPKTSIYVLGREIEDTDNTFRRLLDVSYHEDYEQVKGKFDLTEEKLDAKLTQWTDQRADFATPLPYRDEFCKADIYVLK